MTVDLDDFMRRWTIGRYGPKAAERLQHVTKAAMDTLYSCYNMDMTNRPLYCDWAGGYLPGADSDLGQADARLFAKASFHLGDNA